MKKCFSLTLAVLLTLLTSCSGSSSSDISSADNGVTTETGGDTSRIYPDVTGINYGGESFGVMYFGPGPNDGYSDGFYFSLDPEREAGDILLDSIYHRNQKIEEMLNITLEFTQYVVDSEMLNAMRKDVMSGEGEFDLYVPYLRYYSNLINEDLAVDLTMVNAIDLNAPWWDNRSTDELTVMGGLWGVVSDWTIADKMSSFCVFFSKQLAEDFGLEDHYELVLDGKWTFDYMLEKAWLVENDLNGNSRRDSEDRFGIISDIDFSYEMLHAGGLKIADKDEDDIPSLTVYGEREISALMKIYSVMAENMFLNRKEDPESGGQMTMQKMSQLFANNQALYFQHVPETLLELRQSTNDFGIIPVPKLDENQENYYTPITHWAATYSAIPVSAKDPERSATVLNLLAAESSYEVMPNLYEVVLAVKYARDDESAQMLDIIFDNRLYDIGNICNFGNIAYNVQSDYYRNENFVSAMESIKPTVEAELKSMIEEIRKKQE